MPILAWRARAETPLARPHPPGGPVVRVPGAYAGRARFRPRHEETLPEVLRHAIGRVVEVGFAGVASISDPFAGQQLFLEWCRDDVFDGFIIPEQDLEFLRESPDPKG